MHKRKQTLNHSILGGRRFGPVVIEPLVTAIPMKTEPLEGNCQFHFMGNGYSETHRMI